MDKTKKSDATAQLNEAINKLEAYALLASESPSPSVSKTISMMRNLFMASFDLSPKKRKHKRHPPDKEAVFRAAEFINRKRLFIEKLRKGTPAEQELADAFTKKIDAYNKSCDIRIQKCITGSKGLTSFLRGRNKGAADIPPKIALTQNVTIQKHYPENIASEVVSLSHATKNAASILIPKQSAELFHMKALSLLEKYGIASNPEARAQVKLSPIHVAIEAGSATCTLSQTFSLFPGQTIIVKGSSALDSKTLSISRLFPETFCLSLESTQTGFPHPSQHTGWALTHQLLPETPQRIDLLELTANIFRRRARVISGLLPQGNLLKKGKNLLSEKQRCFQAHGEKLIGLHRQLAHAIVKASPDKSLPQGTQAAITKFYDALLCHPNAFERLTEANHLIRETFIARPHSLLLEAILRGKDTDFSKPDPEIRYHEAERILNESLENAYAELCEQLNTSKLANEKVKFDYVRCLGCIIGDASKQVMLQYFSEDLVYPPPKLSPFECRIQAAAFNHLESFLTDLEKETSPVTVDIFEKDILYDINIFTTQTPFAVCTELSDYFEKRYSSLKDIIAYH